MTIPHDTIITSAHKAFAPALLHWFKDNARPLPWRESYDPYHVWISEIMLQQTQMERGVAYFERWTRELPSPSAVAQANEDDILKLWEGLGYYNRARNLMRAAQIMVDSHDGWVPEDKATLLALPGIGPYTAAAILSIAYEQDEPLVDGNVARVLARVFDLDAPVGETATQKALWALAAELLPAGQARNFNQGLMELGALVCKPRTPVCANCPLAELCEARRLGITEHRPVPGKKVDITPLSIATGVLINKGRIFIQRRHEDDVWGGLWEFPGGGVEEGETPEQAVVREYAEETGFEVVAQNPIRIIKHGYTRFRVTLHCFFLAAVNGLGPPALTAATAHKWATLEELDDHAFPAGHRKLIDALAEDERFHKLLTHSPNTP
ncbi:A/G-specific adenine glycosylase [Desulfovibrio ferrophilus]|uniref:Adenine DNA glycosylase n=1 Tax=Desulfovibrio ferrophilus TaxID=241368 RepID=A0A2Z6AV43_9BACT|nr:A/G-specific adenine glycosylase [Desulfovibrio ferrophilus]BBD07088.1 A/G-specific adenine glycosylase [Desulfovibrio ferrophilus]